MAVHELKGNLRIWWFPKEFCQSRYGEFYQSGKNSCTLIALLLADKIAKQGSDFYCDIIFMPKRVVEIFGLAMNEGNLVYSRAVPQSRTNSGQNHNFSIPDALETLKRSVDFKIKEWYYRHLEADQSTPTYDDDVPRHLVDLLNMALATYMQAIDKTQTRFFFMAVIADSRTVVFVFQFPENTVTFFDSHQHGFSGAVIAQTSLSDISNMMKWFVSMLQTVYKSMPCLYEISFLTIDSLNLPNPSVKGIKYKAKESHKHVLASGSPKKV